MIVAEAVLYIFAVIVLLGAVGAAVLRDPLDKLIAIGLLSAGVIPFLVVKGYFDVAVAVALITPVTTIVILPLCRRDTA
jgi:energy-converting hydrogenase A subunit D